MLSIAAASPTSFASPSMAVRSMRSNVLMQEAAPVEEAAPVFDSRKFAESLPGVTGPLGFFDPLGFCSSSDEKKVSEAKIRFYREVEIKHSRVAMLAAVGFPLAEQFHPLFKTDDAPSFTAFQQTPLQTFWPAVVLAIAIPEIFSVMSFEPVPGGKSWSIQADHESGNLGFDPLDLKPTDPAELKQMQTDELTYGRWGMLATAGMILQEVVTGSKLF